MPYLNRAGVDIYYEVQGNGPALLLTHGYSLTSRMWQPQIAPLSDTHTVIVWDLRGHGQSDAPTDDSAYSEAEVTADMAALLEHIGFDRAVVCGHSMGGYLSLAFVANNPAIVDGLVVVDTGPGFKQDEAREGWNRICHDFARAIEEKGVKALANQRIASAFHKDLTGLVYSARNTLVQHSTRVIESLAAIDVPSLVVVGSDDKRFLAAADYMAGKIPNSSKEVIANAGHMANLDQPDAFNSAVRGFLSSNSL